MAAGREWTLEALELVAARFRVLGEPQRLRLLERLRRGPASVGELTAYLETSQPNASKHLRLLREAGLVSRSSRGTTAVYEIADASVFELCSIVCDGVAARLAAQSGALGTPQAAPSRRGAARAARRE